MGFWDKNGGCFEGFLRPQSVLGGLGFGVVRVVYNSKPTRIPKPKQLLDPNLLSLFFFVHFFLSSFFFNFGSRTHDQTTVGTCARQPLISLARQPQVPRQPCARQPQNKNSVQAVISLVPRFQEQEPIGICANQGRH